MSPLLLFRDYFKFADFHLVFVYFYLVHHVAFNRPEKKCPSSSVNCLSISFFSSPARKSNTSASETRTPFPLSTVPEIAADESGIRFTVVSICSPIAGLKQNFSPEFNCQSPTLSYFAVTTLPHHPSEEGWFSATSSIPLSWREGAAQPTGWFPCFLPCL